MSAKLQAQSPKQKELLSHHHLQLGDAGAHLNQLNIPRCLLVLYKDV